MQGLSAKDTIISPKRKHCTVQFKNVALISGQNLTKWLLGALEIVCVCVSPLIKTYLIARKFLVLLHGAFPAGYQK